MPREFFEMLASATLIVKRDGSWGVLIASFRLVAC